MCTSLKSQLRVGMTPQYFTGILISCMTTTCILCMSHMHALLDLQHGSNSLVKLADLLVGQRRKKLALGTNGHVAMIFFKTFFMNVTQYTSIHNFHSSNLIFKELIFLKFLSMQSLAQLHAIFTLQGLFSQWEAPQAAPPTPPLCLAPTIWPTNPPIQQPFHSPA